MKRSEMIPAFVEPMEDLSKFEAAAASVEHWYSLSRLKKILYFHFWYLIYQLSKRFPQPIKARTFWGVPFRCYLPDYFLTWRYGILGDPSEIALTRFILKNVKSEDVFFDVGANCGFYTLLAGHLTGTSGAVHSFEPTPNVYRILEENVRGMPHVRANELAVSDQNKEAELSMNLIFTVANSLAETSRDPSIARVLVRTTSLDEYCVSYGVIPTFIKIDVEGAEELVIRGARRILTHHSPLVSLEVLSESTGAHLRAVELLQELEYSAYRIEEDGTLERVVLSSATIPKLLSEKGFDNFVFKKAQS